LTAAEKTAPLPGESLFDLYQRLEAQGANLAHLRAITDWETRHRNAATARLARLYFGKKEGESVKPCDFSFRLELLATRAYGVEAAVRTICEADAGKLNQGIVRLVADLAEDLERLSEAYGAELQASWSEGNRAAETSEVKQ